MVFLALPSLHGVPQAGLVEDLDAIAVEFVEAANQAAELAKAEGSQGAGGRGGQVSADLEKEN